ncbi:MAG: LysO family transporter [Spirochaetota bacterium]|nr:MAG: LysO family transporter [Spirochaetota bacterium]
MIYVTISLLLGIGIGFLLKKRKTLLSTIDRLTPGIIFALLFFLGISLGMNEKVIANISKLGLYALLISAGGIAGSICLSIPLYRYLSRPEDKRTL